MRYFFLAALALAAAACSRHSETNDSKEDARPAPPPLAADQRKVIAVFGDSLSAGYGLTNGQSFPDQLQKKIDTYRVVNLGISGDTTEGGVSRIDSATSLKPAIVIIELGGNDGLRGMPLTATRANLEQMIAAFQKSGAKIVLAGMTLPPNYGTEYIAGFQKIYKDLAVEHKLTLIPFLLSDIVTKDMRYFQPDGIHPTAQGAEIVAGTVFTAIQPLLQR